MGPNSLMVVYVDPLGYLYMYIYTQKIHIYIYIYFYTDNIIHMWSSRIRRSRTWACAGEAG